jgi:hypothetical protein
LLLRIDWNKILGKRFPWTINNVTMDSDENIKKPGKKE